jgi:hypothetical protein
MKTRDLFAAVVAILAGPVLQAYGAGTNRVESVSATTNALAYKASPLISGTLVTMPAQNGGAPVLSIVVPGAAGAVSNIVISPSLFTTNNLVSLTPSRTKAVQMLLPGVYQSTPYSGRVIVPSLIDEQMVSNPGSTSEFAILSLNPPLSLEPKK